MASTADLLIDSLGRIKDGVADVLTGLTAAQLAIRPAPGANPIGWLVWHLTRVQDDHVAAAAGTGQRWTEERWVDRFGLPFDPSATGYGQDADAVTLTRVDPGLLRAYHDAVHDASVAFVRPLSDADLDRIVDRRWDPPVTLGVRLVSVLCDDLQHVGQAAYVKGILARQAP